MLRSLYSGVSGMRGFQTKLDVIGNNIANVNTIGFKGGRVMFQDILSQTTSGVTAPNGQTSGGVNAKQIGLGSTTSAIDTIHTQGSAMTTNVPTDLRVAGDGFFMVADAAGTTYLTRAGNFNLDAAGNLVNSDGLILQGTQGPIQIDPATVTAFSIAQNGEVMTTVAGVTGPSGNQVAVAKVTNPAGLEKIGGNLYRETANSTIAPEAPGAALANDPARGTGAIIAGQLEMSNVELTAEFTEMIVAQRGFQANSRIITTSDTILDEVINLKR